MPLEFLYMCIYFAVLSGSLVVTSDMTHTGIRRTRPLNYSEHVYNDSFRDEMSVRMNYCMTFQCTTNIV